MIRIIVANKVVPVSEKIADTYISNENQGVELKPLIFSDWLMQVIGGVSDFVTAKVIKESLYVVRKTIILCSINHKACQYIKWYLLVPVC